MFTFMLPLMKLQMLNHELSEFQEETNTLTSSSSRLHHPHPANKPKLSSQNKTSTRTWFTFSLRKVKLPQMSRSDDQLPQDHKNPMFTSSDTRIKLLLPHLHPNMVPPPLLQPQSDNHQPNTDFKSNLPLKYHHTKDKYHGPLKSLPLFILFLYYIYYLALSDPKAICLVSLPPELTF